MEQPSHGGGARQCRGSGKEAVPSPPLPFLHTCRCISHDVALQSIRGGGVRHQYTHDSPPYLCCHYRWPQQHTPPSNIEVEVEVDIDSTHEVFEGMPMRFKNNGQNFQIQLQSSRHQGFRVMVHLVHSLLLLLPWCQRNLCRSKLTFSGT